MKNADKIVAMLLESDIDPKEFANYATSLDLETLRADIESAVPGVKVANMYALRGYHRGDMQRQDFYLYTAREPVSDDPHDHRNSLTRDEQIAVKDQIKRWCAENHATLVEILDIATRAVYKGVSRCSMLRVMIDTNTLIRVTGDDNDKTSQTVTQKRPI